jgi:hypothetical protein
MRLHSTYPTKESSKESSGLNQTMIAHKSIKPADGARLGSLKIFFYKRFLIAMPLSIYLVSLLAAAKFAQPTPALSTPVQTTAVIAHAHIAEASPDLVTNFVGGITPLLNRNGLTVSQWPLALGLLLTGGTLSWGISQYQRQQRWQRIEFLRRAIREFEQDLDIRNALKILDFEEYRDYCVPAQFKSEPFYFRANDELLCNALANHAQRIRLKQQLDLSQDQGDLDPEALRQYQIETTLRDWFNKMLNGLEHFGYFIESGLFSQKELAPWLNYWIKLIADPAYRRPGASKFYDALYSYIHHSGFFGVQKLFERFGYRILPSPYKDSDLLDISFASPYSTRLALALAKASHLAYQDKQFVAEVVGRWGAALSAADGANDQPKQLTQQPVDPRTARSKDDFIRQNFRYFNNKGRDTQAYIFRSHAAMVLAFRGSQESHDWITNLTTQLCNFTIRKNGATTLSSYKGRVHTGFFLAWAIIEPAVLDQLARWQQAAAAQGTALPPLYVTGHSLGGALATIAAAALSDNGIEVAGVYTFGQPRVGDRTFSAQLNAHTNGKVFRFVNRNDIVPHVPPPFSVWNPTRLYGHVGTVKYFNARGIIMAKYKLTSRLADSFLGLVKGLLGAGFDLITDHRMEYYISHLDSALVEEAENNAAQMLEVGGK